MLDHFAGLPGRSTSARRTHGMAEDTKDDGPDYAEENALRNASESLHNYDPAADTFTAVFGAPVPAATILGSEAMSSIWAWKRSGWARSSPSIRARYRPRARVRATSRAAMIPRGFWVKTRSRGSSRT